MQQKLYRGIDDLSLLLAENDVWDPLLLKLDNFHFNDSHSIITSSLEPNGIKAYNALYQYSCKP